MAADDAHNERDQLVSFIRHRSTFGPAPSETGQPGLLLSIREPDRPDQVTSYWAQYEIIPSTIEDSDQQVTWPRPDFGEMAARAVAKELNSDTDAIESGEVRFVRLGLGVWREVTQVAVIAVASGVAGAIGADLWTRVKTTFSRGAEPEALQSLDRAYADHLARWFVATEWEMGHWRDGDLHAMFTVLSETREGPNAWTFVYSCEDGAEFTIRLEHLEGHPHAIVASTSRRPPQTGA